MQSELQVIGQGRWIKTKNGTLVAESPWTKNKVAANDGRGVFQFLDRLANITTYDGVIEYADLGTSDTAPTVNDTDLNAGVVRSQLAAASRNGLSTDFRFFFPDAVTPDDTYNEVGMFTDGSPTLGSGQLFNHLVFSTPLVKAEGEDHTVQIRITITIPS